MKKLTAVMSILTLTFILFSWIPGNASAADASAQDEARVVSEEAETDEAQEANEAAETERASSDTDLNTDAYGGLTGWIEPDIRIPAGADAAMPDHTDEGEALAGESSIPSAYNLKDLGLVTSVKSQVANNCWAFAELASGESTLLKKYGTDVDLSESHLTYFSYDTAQDEQPLGCEGDSVILRAGYNYYNFGGDALISIPSLMRQVGAVDESLWPNDAITDTSYEKSSTSYSRNSYVLTDADLISVQDRNSIKTEIMNYGAVTMPFYISISNYYNSSTYAYYCPIAFSANHEVCIVGWDDNYPKSNFKTQPSGDGAWLAKNSYGTSFGSSGYFWLSYEDAGSLSQSSACLNFTRASSAYSRVYQYDGGIGTMRDIESSGAGWMSNMFTADTSSTVKAVSFMTVDPSLSYTVDIYTGCSVKPDDGSLASEVSGTMPCAGYHTVKLAAPVRVEKGEKFSVVVKLTGSNEVSLVYDATYDGMYKGNIIMSYISSSSSGQSFMSIDGGNNWTDESSKGNKNYRIKAYADVSNGTITLKSGTFTYNGLTQTPAVASVKDSSGNVLTEGTDYVLILPASSVDAGTYTAEAVSASDKTNVIAETDYTIKAADLGSAAVSVNPSSDVYDGNEKKTSVTVSWTNGSGTKVTLSEDQDYTVYIPSLVEAGNYTLTLSGEGNFSGVAYGQFRIKGPVDTGLYRVTAKPDGSTEKALNIAGNSSDVGANVEINETDTSTAQEFYFLELDSGYYRITDIHSGKVLDVDGGGTSDGTNVQQYFWNGTDAQLWKIVKDGTGYRILSKASGKAMDISGASVANGANVQIWVVNASAAQRWYLSAVDDSSFEVTPASSIVSGKTYRLISKIDTVFSIGLLGGKIVYGTKACLSASAEDENEKFLVTLDSDGTYQLLNEKCGLSLDVSGNSPDNGASVQTYLPNGTTAQKWNFVKNTDGTFTILNSTTKKAIDVPGGTVDFEKTLQMYSANGSNAQRFYFQEVTAVDRQWEGNYTIYSQVNGTSVMDVYGGLVNSGANVQLWESNGSGAQQFRFIYSGDGYYRIINMKSGMAVDIDSGSTAAGANIHQFFYNGSNAQLWKISSNSDGSVTFLSKAGMAIDVSGGLQNNGANIQTYSQNGTKAQKWKLSKLS
ncbi:MAG TPA: RICIN domain-containing protein [Lachnospiraceae bacterium]|nr:RICIN domain-containing protein [Lachnospiraceae bacterium]